MLYLKLVEESFRFADEFIDGGNITKDQPLIWIDDRDYKLASISAESRVAQAKKLLEREMAESELAKKDWEKNLEKVKLVRLP